MKQFITFSLILTVVFTLGGAFSTQANQSEGMMQHGKQSEMMQSNMMQQAGAHIGDQPSLWVANGLDDNLSVINLTTGKVVATIETGMNPHILSASPDGRIVYVINAGAHDREPGAHADESEASGAEKEVHHANTTTQPTEEEKMPQKNGEDLLANSLWAFDALSGQVIAKIPVGMGPTHPVPSPDGRWVYVTNTDEDSVSVIDTSSWQVVATLTDLPEPHDGELSLDGSLLFLATSEKSTLTVVETATREVLRTFPIGKKPRGLVVGGTDGKTVYLTNKGDGTLSIIDVPQGKIQTTVPVGKGAHALRVSPDGSIVYVSLSKENSVAVVDARTGDVLKKIPVGQTPEQIDISRDGRWVFAGNNAEGTVSIIDTKQSAVTATIPVGRGTYGLQFVEKPASLLTSLPKNTNGYANMTAVQLKQALEQKDFTLLNVHIPYAGDIPETDLQIPFNQIVENLDKLPGKDQPIVLYCRSGSMSTAASRELVSLGYTNIVELSGGFNTWKQAGYELDIQTVKQ